MKTPTAYRLMSAGGISLEDDEQQAGQYCQEDDADRERQAVTPEGELVRQEVIARQQRRQAREVGVAGVSRQRQDEERGDLEHGKHEVERPGKHFQRDLPDDGRVAGWDGLEVIGHRQHGRADEERPQDYDHPGEGGGGVARLGLLEGGDAVGDGLGSCERRAAGGKGFQDQED